MHALLTRLAGGPALVDEEQRGLAGTLTILIATLLLGSAPLVLLSALRGLTYAVAGLLLSDALLVACLILTRLGHLTLPRYLVPFVALAVTTYLLFRGEGIHDIAVLGLSVALAMAGLVLGKRGTVVYGLLGIASLAAVYAGERAGVVASVYASLTTFDDVLMMAVLLGLAAAFMYLAMDRLSSSLRRVRESERALLVLNEALERRVAERTAELEAANEHLLALSRVKDAFVSNVSHELRTPIANLKLYLGLLPRRPERSAAYLATLERETDRLEVLIENLLTLSRLEQDRLDFTLAVVDLNTLAAEYVTDRTPLADEKGLALTFAADSDLPAVQADPSLLGQVVSILLTNALNYTPRGGQVVVSTGTRQVDGRQWAGLRVSDSGPGIAEDEVAYLTSRFFRGRAGRDSGVPGTGLGLAIAKEIVERHSGCLEVVPAGLQGKGATFEVWLPL